MQQHTPPRRDLHTLAAAFFYSLLADLGEPSSEQQEIDLGHIKGELREMLVDAQLLPPLPADPEPNPSLNALAAQVSAGLNALAAHLRRDATTLAQSVDTAAAEGEQFVARVSEFPAQGSAQSDPVSDVRIDVRSVQTENGSEPMSASLITHNLQVWVVGENHPGHVFSIEGIYLSETEAESHCPGFTHFIAPINIGVPMPQPRTYWPGLRYPKMPPAASERLYYAAESAAPQTTPNAT